MPPVAPIALVAPWWLHRARGAARYTPFAGLPAAEQAWRGARAVICRTHPSGELWPRSEDSGVVILIIYDVRMILSLNEMSALNVRFWTETGPQTMVSLGPQSIRMPNCVSRHAYCP